MLNPIARYLLEQPVTVAVGPVLLNTITRSLQVNGTPVDLTSAEYLVLLHLMQQAGTTLSRQALEHAIYGDRVVLSNVLQVYMGRLRKKLEAVGVDAIQTVWGTGYRYQLPKAVDA